MPVPPFCQTDFFREHAGHGRDWASRAWGGWRAGGGLVEGWTNQGFGGRRGKLCELAFASGENAGWWSKVDDEGEENTSGGVLERLLPVFARSQPGPWAETQRRVKRVFEGDFFRERLGTAGASLEPPPSAERDRCESRGVLCPTAPSPSSRVATRAPLGRRRSSSFFFSFFFVHLSAQTLARSDSILYQSELSTATAEKKGRIKLVEKLLSVDRPGPPARMDILFNLQDVPPLASNLLRDWEKDHGTLTAPSRPSGHPTSPCSIMISCQAPLPSPSLERPRPSRSAGIPLASFWRFPGHRKEGREGGGMNIPWDLERLGVPGIAIQGGSRSNRRATPHRPGVTIGSALIAFPPPQGV